MELPPKGQRNELHLVAAPNGHVKSTDCWCEPVNIGWVTNKHGVLILVVEHEDYTLAHHQDVLDSRKEHPDAIDNLLNSLDQGEPNAD